MLISSTQNTTFNYSRLSQCLFEAKLFQFKKLDYISEKKVVVV